MLRRRGGDTRKCAGSAGPTPNSRQAQCRRGEASVDSADSPKLVLTGGLPTTTSAHGNICRSACRGAGRKTREPHTLADTTTLRASRLAIVAGVAVAGLTAAYLIVLAVGLLRLPSMDHQIQDPWFTLMELLILGIAPTMVVFSVGLHARVPVSDKPAALLAVGFMSMCAAVTCCVHFTILVLSRLPSFHTQEWASLVFAFRWPSIAYAMDILAWDLFFALGAACSAVALRNRVDLRIERRLFFVAATLALLGLAGVPLADMTVRNVGIIGYAVVFPVATALLAARLARPPGRDAG